MNENTPMTPAQQLFAEEHHNLVYAFLNEKKLPELSEGMNIPVEETKVSEHFTAPPKHFTDVIHFESRQWKYSKCKGAG